jgi:hypothetical protein
LSSVLSWRCTLRAVPGAYSISMRPCSSAWTAFSLAGGLSGAYTPSSAGVGRWVPEVGGLVLYLSNVAVSDARWVRPSLV